jgi:hypothetical protein
MTAALLEHESTLPNPSCKSPVNPTNAPPYAVFVGWEFFGNTPPCRLDNPLGVSNIENELPSSIFGYDVCSPPPQCVAVCRLHFASC